MLSGKLCAGDKEVEVVPYGERTSYAKVLKKEKRTIFEKIKNLKC